MDRHHAWTEDASHDVVVVGARCAGAATAMLLAQAGVDVLVVDRAEFPSDTLSTHAIARGGVVQLARWGLLERIVESGAPPIRTVSFHLPDGELVKQVRDSSGVDHFVAPRRHVLDTILLDAAREAGASLCTGVSVTGTVTDATGRVSGVMVRDRDGTARRVSARFVVGADGVRSRIARSVDAGVVERRLPGGATQYVYVSGLDAQGFEFHVGEQSLAGVFPTHGGEANVWLCTPPDRVGLVAGRDRTTALLRLLDDCAPSLAERVRCAAVGSPVRTAIGLPNHVVEAAGPGWALVGDAGYHRDPITGHGITDAFRDAELLARSLVATLLDDVPETVAMADYERARDCALAEIFDVTCRLSQFPPVPEFVALQKKLSSLVDAEAEWLAALPPLRACCTAAA
jgi:2-polyprenyl-6-methoxyphenol hydroxylase-like FAD-dependent oxidoreductase